jgi:cystathionine beta-lyase/cystathionine gamma-synthase
VIEGTLMLGAIGHGAPRKTACLRAGLCRPKAPPHEEDHRHGPRRHRQLAPRNPRAARRHLAFSEHGETSEALFLTSGYTYDDAQTVADRFAGTAQGMTYSRLQNPTVAMLEERIALMEGAEACRTQATGMAAMTAALLCQLSAGDHVVAARAAFGSCRWLVDNLLPKFGIETTVIDSADNAAWEAAIRPNTKVFFFETPANPTLDIVDLAMSAAWRGRTGSPPWSTMPSPRRCCSARWNSARMWWLTRRPS